MRRLTPSLILALASCGPLDDLVHGRPGEAQNVKPRTVQAWQGSQQLAANKAIVVAAAHQRGASDATISLLLAMLMQETVDGEACQRDATKDCAGDAKNWSAFNLNSACLRQLGWQEGQGPDLNDQANLGAATGWVLTGLEHLGENGMMNFHRGGQTSYNDGHSYGADAYRAQMRQVQAYLQAHREAWVNGQRIGGNLPHV